MDHLTVRYREQFLNLNGVVCIRGEIFEIESQQRLSLHIPIYVAFYFHFNQITIFRLSDLLCQKER